MTVARLRERHKIQYQHWELVREDESEWYETEQDVAEGLHWGRQKAWLLDWVHEHLPRLGEKQREYLILYYFHGKSYRDVAEIEGVNVSTAYRMTQRGVDLLRRFAKAQGMIH